MKEKAIRTTQPIREIENIAKMKEVLPSVRDRILFTIGINTGLRISDLVKLKPEDFKDGHIEIREQKTGKVNRLKVSDSVWRQIKEYIDAYPKEWMFTSRKGGHISTHQAWVIISAAGKKLGLEHIGTHSMRKTFGYHAWKQGKNITLIQDALNHSSQRITMKYLGISEDIKNKDLYGQMGL